MNQNLLNLLFAIRQETKPSHFVASQHTFRGLPWKCLGLFRAYVGHFGAKYSPTRYIPARTIMHGPVMLHE
jgi:hypothetical protein